MGVPAVEEEGVDMNPPPPPRGVSPVPDAAARNSAGFRLMREAEAAPLRGLIFPPVWGVRERGVIKAMGRGGPAEGGASTLCVNPTLYSGNGVTLGASGRAP